MRPSLDKIIKKCRKNDRQAQSDLYHHCFDYLLSICFRYRRQREDAVSLLNDAFLKILLNINDYDARKEFLPWAATITVRTAIDEHRRNHQYRSKTELKAKDEDFETNFEHLIDQLSAEEVQEMIFSLPEKERMVFSLFEWEGYQHQEIAQMLDCSERSCKRYLAKAKELLKAKLEKKQDLKRVI